MPCVGWVGCGSVSVIFSSQLSRVNGVVWSGGDRLLGVVSEGVGGCGGTVVVWGCVGFVVCGRCLIMGVVGCAFLSVWGGCWRSSVGLGGNKALGGLVGCG